SKASQFVRDIADAANKQNEDIINNPTNMLPEKCDIVFSVPVRHFMSNPLGLAAFTRGAFRPDDFNKRFGVPFHNIEQLVIGSIREHSQTLAVIRTQDPYEWSAVQAAFQIDPASKKT